MTIPATVLELVVGLVADGIALSTFLAGLWGKSTEGESLPSLILFYVLSGLLIIYGWLTLSWVLTRRGLNYIPKARRVENFRVVAQGVSGVGGDAPLRRHSRTALNGLPLTRLFGTRGRRPVRSKPCRYAEASISEKPGAGKPCAGACPEIVKVICAGAVE